MSKFKITNADSPIEKDLYQDIPIKDPETGLDQVDSEGNILAKRYVTRSINKNGINNIKRALPQINVNKSEIARIDTYAKNQVDAINTSIKDIEDNVLQNQKDLSDHDTRISAIQSKLNNIQGIDIDEVQADVDALKKSAYLNTGGVLNGDVSIQTPNTAVLTLTPKGSSSYASFSTNNDVLDCTTTWGKVFKASKDGKYFYGLADKATADKRGQDVTSYIRSITGANATLTITKGDDTSQSLSINNVLQATKAIQDKNGAQIDTTYFKSANGTFTGVEYFRDVNNSLLRFNGGNTHDGGACLQLYGKDANGAQGVFDLVACTKEDASNAKQLLGTPAGALTWDNKHIVRSINGINANAFGDVAFTQLVTGLITATYLAGATGAALVSSTAPGGAYVAFTRGASRNGVFCTSTFEDRYEVHYINNEIINAGQNSITKTAVLLNEAGDSAFPGIVYGTFSGNLSGTASHATASDTADNAGMLTGFANHQSTIPWGVQTGTPIMSMNDGTGGSVGFRRDCPSNGKTSMIIDGYIYQNEGQYQVIDTNTIGSQSVNYANSAGNADTLDGYHHDSFPKVNSALFTVNGLASPGWSAIGTGKGGSCIQVKTTDNTYPSICFHRSGYSHCVLAESDGQLGTMQEGNGTFNYLITTANIGSQSVNHATTADRAYPRKVDGGDINFHWEGRDGQPIWLWGGEDGTNMYVYNPATFSVNRANVANEATNAYNLRATSHNDHFVRSEWDGTYFWTWVRAPDGGYRPVRVERANSAGYADNAGTASRSTNNGSFFINGYEVSVG